MFGRRCDWEELGNREEYYILGWHIHPHLKLLLKVAEDYPGRGNSNSSQLTTRRIFASVSKRRQRVESVDRPRYLAIRGGSLDESTFIICAVLPRFEILSERPWSTISLRLVWWSAMLGQTSHSTPSRAPKFDHARYRALHCLHLYINPCCI